jgi:hypothetical protein
MAFFRAQWEQVSVVRQKKERSKRKRVRYFTSGKARSLTGSVITRQTMAK